MTNQMTRHEREVADALIDAFEQLEFEASPKDWIVLHPEAFLGQQGPAVLVRHPLIVVDGINHLIAIVSIQGGTMSITYCLPMYRQGVETALMMALKPPRDLGEP